MHDPGIVDELMGWVIGVAVVLLVPVWRIHKRAGLPPALSLLIFIPAVGVIASSLILASSRWHALDVEFLKFISP